MNRIACLNCRTAKKKCDFLEPTCTRCLQTGKKCQYELSCKRKPATYRYISTLRTRIEVLEKALKMASNSQPNVQCSKINSIYPNLRELNFGKNVSTDEEEPNGEAYNFDINTTQWDLKINNGRIFFEGPSSSRYIPSTGYTGAKILEEGPSFDVFDDFHQEIFKWFFATMNKSLPLLDQELFFSSLHYSIEHDARSEFAPTCLVNSIMTLWFFSKGKEHEEFYLLAKSQVNADTNNGSTIGTVQTLILLSIIEMTMGNEYLSSDFIARAVAACYHLGLHVNSRNLVKMGKLDEREAKLRDSVFWCCFLVDRMRCTILGMHPYIYCTHISIELPKTFQNDDSRQDIEIFRDTICFSDLQLKILQDYYSVDFSRCADLSGPRNAERNLMERELQYSAGEALMEEWWKNVSSNSRFRSKKSFNAAHLYIYLLTYKILINKPLLVHPIQTPIQQTADHSPISVCSRSSKEIIEICSSYNLNESLMLPQLFYALYLSCIICLFNRYSSNKSARKEGDYLFSTGLGLLQRHCPLGQVANTYYCNLMMFEKQCQTISSSLNTKKRTVQDDEISHSDSSSKKATESVMHSTSAKGSSVNPQDKYTPSPVDVDFAYDPLWSEFSNFLDPLLQYDRKPPEE